MCKRFAKAQVAGYDPTTSVLETGMLPITPHLYILEYGAGIEPA